MTTTVKKIKKARLEKLFKKATSKSKKNPSAFFGKLKDGLDGLTFQRRLRQSWTSIHIRPKKKTSRWVAINSMNKIISEGTNANSVSKKAEKITANFALAFIPKEGESYVL